MSSNAVVGVVAAGGYGTRARLGFPKPLLTLGGETLLRSTVAEMLKSGIATIVVLTDRPEFYGQTTDAVAGLKGVCVVPSRHCNSTVSLLHDLRDHLLSPVLFTYGHAPRPASL